MQPHVYASDLRLQIQSRLDRFVAEDALDPELRRAAVAIVITRYPGRDEPGILITLRPTKLNRHGGQFALPGGRLDAGESAQDAALRELREELGLALVLAPM